MKKIVEMLENKNLKNLSDNLKLGFWPLESAIGRNTIVRLAVQGFQNIFERERELKCHKKPFLSLITTNTLVQYIKIPSDHKIVILFRVALSIATEACLKES